MTTSNKNLISKTLAKRMMACIEEYEAFKLQSNWWQNITKYPTGQRLLSFECL